MMKIEFSTREYEFAHGKLPRGRGHWAFECVELFDELYWVHGDGMGLTYAEAKREATAYARQKAVELDVRGGADDYACLNVCP